jgi:hypothetical protein
MNINLTSSASINLTVGVNQSAAFKFINPISPDKVTNGKHLCTKAAIGRAVRNRKSSQVIPNDEMPIGMVSTHRACIGEMATHQSG